MTYYRKVIVYIGQDLFLKQKFIIALLSIIPFAMVMSTLPIQIGTISTWSNWKEFIFSFRFEFFYCPIFIILIGSIFSINDWIILRRYERREQLANHKIFAILVISGIYTLVNYLAGFIISTTVKYIVYPNFQSSYSAFFLYQPKQAENPFIDLMVITFFLIISIVGLFFIVLKELLNGIVSAFIIISLVILDSFTTKLIPIYFAFGYIEFPINTFITLISTIILLVIIFQLQCRYKDFIDEDEYE